MNEHLREAPSPGQPAGDAPRRRRHPLARLYALVRSILAIGMLVVLLLIFTPIPEKLYAWLDVTEPATHADYIVCLGGNPARLVWTVQAYRDGLAPRVIVSNRRDPAEWMAKRLVEAGIPKKAILIDGQSGTTADHPAGLARLPGVDPVRQRFLIVTDYDHSRRAAACFRHGGYRNFSIHGAGFSYKNDPEHASHIKWRIQALPRLGYECAALVKYWVEGKM